MRPTDNFKKFNDSQRHALDTRRNLAVRANAGSGKTSVLVERIAQLLAQSWDHKKPLDLTQIVAITFTRKAAAELEDRLRSTFREMASLTADSAERAFWAARIEELPRAMIGTIDSFCARVLREFGLLDPSPDRIEPDFTALEPYEAIVLKREAINRLIDELASGVSNDPGSPTANRQLEACQWWAESEGYYALTNYLMELLDHAVEPRTIVEAHGNLASPAERVRAAWEKLPAVQALKKNRAELIDELQTIISKIEGIDKRTLEDLHERLGQALVGFRRSEPDSIATGLQNLRDALFTQEGERRSTRAMKEVAEELIPLQEKWCPLLECFEFDYQAEVRALDAADKLALLLGPAYENYLALCREANQYDFWTVARKTRDSLARDRQVCAELKARHRYVMMDEFQDTNQLQWEIISWMVGNGPDGSLDKDRLFIVGDPQQSIYRFRKADVSVFSRVQEMIQEANERHGADRIPTVFDSQQRAGSSDLGQRLGIIPLRENYRSLKPMPLELMDRVFQYVFDPRIHDLDLERNKFEIRYQNLIPGVDCDAVGEICYIVAGEAETDSAAEEETDQEGVPLVQDLAGRQVQAVIDELASLRGQPKHIVKSGEENTLSWKDMAILLPSRDVVLGKLEKELTRRGIPYVVTSGIGFWQRQEVRDVVSLACFLANSGDELALFAVLRGPAGQLGDREILFLSQLGRGRMLKGLRWLLHDDEPLEPLQDAGFHESKAEAEELRPPESISEPLPTVLADFWNTMDSAGRARLRQVAHRLDGWRKRVDRMAHSDLLQRCLEESGAYAIYAAEPEGELILANLRRLFERIRGEESRSALGLARLARWMRDQVDDALRDEQAVLAAGHDALQIMTVHAAKGLEFPVVAVLKMERRVDRSRYPRLLVKSEWDPLLAKDDQIHPEIRPGTLSFVVRHPRRPRESYTPRLLKALRELEKTQELAESRRLFYVAATRAKERLILAGRQPRQKKDGGSYQLPPSWQKWFEDALQIGDEHKQNGAWEDRANHFKVRIITDMSPSGARIETPSPPIPNRICLDYLHERTQSPSIATTGLDLMRETWRQSPHDWWLRYRVNVRPHMPKANPKSEIRNPTTDISNSDSEESLGMVIGTMVHRLFEMGPEALRASKDRQTLLQAMAVNILASSPLQDNPDEGEEGSAVGSHIVAAVVSSVEHLVQRLSAENGTPIRRLLETQGESEVEFLLNIGRWHITGRFDKLIPQANGRYEIVDWKTDRGSDWQEIVERYRENQMKLYALALQRSGRAALIDGAVRVHLALLHHGRVETLRFSLQELETFASDLENELQEMHQLGE